jgi:hypothetical protein
MAVVDINNLYRYHEIFPELTDIQADTCLLAGMGVPVKKIAGMRGVSPETVKQTLLVSRGRMELGSLSDLRLAVNIRLTLVMMDRLNYMACDFSPNS